MTCAMMMNCPICGQCLGALTWNALVVCLHVVCMLVTLRDDPSHGAWRQVNAAGVVPDTWIVLFLGDILCAVLQGVATLASGAVSIENSVHSYHEATAAVHQQNLLCLIEASWHCSLGIWKQEKALEICLFVSTDMHIHVHVSQNSDSSNRHASINHGTININ